MELEPTELDELAAFFGRRPDVQLPATAIPGVHVSMEARWRECLGHWQRTGQLSARLHRIRRDHPDDDMLNQVTSVVLDPGRAQERWVGMLFVAAGMTALAAGVLVSLVGGIAWTMVQPHPASPVTSFTQTDIPEARVGPSRTVSRLEKRAVTRCRNARGRVGYWYAGERAPGEVGDSVLVDRFVNVRVDYPRAGNRWKTDSRIVCVLRPGDLVELKERPVHVDGGRVWVPMTDDTLTPANDVVVRETGTSTSG